MAAAKVSPSPVYGAQIPGKPVPNIFPVPPNMQGGYVWGYSGVPPMMQASGADGTYGWPIYIQGGTASNPQFAYFPVPQGAVPQNVPEKHRRRSAKESDDDEKCDCHECTHAKRSEAPPPPVAPAGIPGPHPHPGAFIQPQFFTQPATTTQQTTTFIPYVVPTCSNHCKSKSTSESSSSRSTSHKHHAKKSSTSSYHYAEGCDCPTCKARRVAMEMERIQEGRQREREYKDAKEFLKMKERVDREEREATLEDFYRTKKAYGKNVSFEEPAHTCRHMPQESEAGYEWVAFPTVPASQFPITAFHPGGTTPITLQPVQPGPLSGPWISELEEENARLRHQKDHLKEKIRRERSLRNKDEATRAFLSTRLNDLDQGVQELKKKDRDPQGHGGANTKAPVVEIQVPFTDGKHHHKKSKEKGRNDSKNSTHTKGSGDHVTFKTKKPQSKHKNPHVCYDSDCDDFDSCSECSFECSDKGCRTCRPRGGRS